MNQLEFRAQMDRLIKAFEPKAYPSERINVFWGYLKHMPAEWWQRTVTQLIAECSRPPLMKEIQEHINHFEDAKRQKEKTSERIGAEQFWNGTFYPEDEAMMIKTMQKRIRGEISDEDYKIFIDSLNQTIKSVKQG